MAREGLFTCLLRPRLAAPGGQGLRLHRVTDAPPTFVAWMGGQSRRKCNCRTSLLSPLCRSGRVASCQAARLPLPASPAHRAHHAPSAQGWRGGRGPGAPPQEEGAKRGQPGKCQRAGSAALPLLPQPDRPALLAHLCPAERPPRAPRAPGFLSPTDGTLENGGEVHTPENSPS